VVKAGRHQDQRLESQHRRQRDGEHGDDAGAGQRREDHLAEMEADGAGDIEKAVEMMHLNRGIFDEASVAVITSATVGEIGRLAAQHQDVRRFRPNILIASVRSVPFEEDEWVGGVLWFGEPNAGVAIAITNRDERCSMVNFDPDSARPAAEILKAIVRVRDNKAGVYGTVTRRGRLAVGQPIFFAPAAEDRDPR